MYRVVPLVAIPIALYFVASSAVQLSNTASAINSTHAVMSEILANQADAPTEQPADKPPEPPSPGKARVIQRTAEPVYKSLIHCLSDFDDILDTIQDPVSFAAARPKLLARAQEQSDYAKAFPGQGMSRLSKSAAKELQQAINRHSESLERAIRVAPGVKPFFEKELAPILGAK
jgi:hypothetical protein